MKKLLSPRSRVSASARPTGWRLAIVSVVLVAFVLQGFIVQTHIHFAPAGLARLTGYSSADTAPAATGTPGQHAKHAPSDNPAYCPICQVATLAGFFVATTTVVLHVPFAWIETGAPVFTARTVSGAVAHDWQSRAPPIR
jgi:hypothetical protein